MHRSRLVLALLLTLLVAAPAAAQTPDSWMSLDTGFYARDLPGVQALTVGPDGRLYAGGAILNLAGHTPEIRGVAVWDGTAWAPVGPTDPDEDTGLFAAAFGPDGYLYGGGARYLSGVRIGHIGVFDGTAWEGLRTGTDRSVYDLAFGPDGLLYVVGEFEHAAWLLPDERVEAHGVAVWDGAAWAAVGETGFGEADHPLAVEVGPDGRVYVGGEFDGLVQMWDGTAWAVLPGLPPGQVFDLAFGPDGRLYAACHFFVGGDPTQDDAVMAWDGAAWAQVGPAFPASDIDEGTPKALAFGPAGQLYVGGSFGVRDNGPPPRGLTRLDGATPGEPGSGTWADLDGGVYLTESKHFVSDGVNALAVGPDGVVYVGGFFNKAGPGLNAYHVAAWGGDRVPVASAPSPDVAGLAVSVSPNPSRGAASVSMTLAGGQAVRVAVVDALGRTVAVVHEGPLGAGRHRLSLPLSLAPGVYAVRVVASEAVTVARWVVAR